MKNEIDYENKNGLLFPLLTLTQTEEQPLGKYGRMYLDYIKKHRRGTNTTLLTEGNLAAYLADFDRETREQVKDATAKLAASAGVTEALKATDPLTWAKLMNVAKAIAEEIVLRDYLN